MPRALTSLRRRLFLARMRRRVGARHFAAFGPRSVIVPPAVVVGRRYIHLGDEVLIHDRVWFSVVDEHNGVRYRPRLTIGDRARIGRDVWFSCVGTIEVGADVLVGDGVLITDTYHEYRDVTRPISAQPMAEPRDVRIGAGALLGINSAILAGVTIGPGAFVGAGAVVTEDVPAHAVAAGNPARVIRHWDAAAGAWREGAPDGPGG